MNEESAYPCPVCHTLTTLEHPCPGCGRAPDRNAAAVITLDGRILDLRTRIDEAKRAHDGLVAELAELRRERELYATAVRQAVALEKSSAAPTVPVAAKPWSAPGQPEMVAIPPAQPGMVVIPPTRAEARPRTVQNLLFILGGIVLAIAAMIFTSVAWATFGVGGRAVILGIVTLATLSVPPLVRLRHLNATAETFAALGLFLILLDGYAAWFVNLAGVQQIWAGSAYAGAVCAVTALVGTGYGLLFRLASPRFIALIAAQPVLPLFLVESSPRSDIWALALALTALGNAAVVWRKARPAGLTAVAWGLHAFAVLGALGLAAAEWGAEGTVRASLTLVAVALVFAAGAWAGGDPVHRGVAAAATVLVVVAAVERPLGERLTFEHLLVAWSATVALIALLAWLAHRTISNPWVTGMRWGSMIALFIPAALGVFGAATYGALNLHDATPWFHAEPVSNASYQWELPASLALLTAAGMLVTEGILRRITGTFGVVVLAMALPGWVAVTPYAPSAVDLVGAAILLLCALILPGRLGLIVMSCGAGFLAAHGILAGLGEPVRAMLVLTAVIALALAVSTLAPRNALRPGVTIDGRFELAGVAAGVTDLLLPWLAFTVVAAFGGERVASWRILLVVVLALPILGFGRAFRGYHVVAGLITALYPLWPVLPTGESQAIYAAGSAVAMTLVGVRCGWAWVRWTPLLPAFVTVLWTGQSWIALLLKPFGNVGRIWAGDAQTPHVPVPHAVAITLLLGCLAAAKRLRLLALCAVIPALMWLAVFDVPWPVITAVTLLGGLAVVLVSALRGKDLVLFLLGALLTLSGLAGALPEEWTTITALSLIAVAMAAIGAGAKALHVRVMGWVAGAVAKVLLAIAIGQAANLRPELTAYLVLGVAGVLLAIAYTPAARGASAAVEASAHAAALVALSFCGEAPRHAAAVLAIWGVAIGLTALRKQPVARAAFAALAEAAAWITLLRGEKVGLLEAYTLPIALLAVAAGVLAAYRRRGLPSWIAYGPALAAAFLPSLGAVFVEPENLNRRLLLGVGALLVTIAGAIWRRQAPFIMGGVTLLVLALHELMLVWQRVSAWIPLALGGLLLVAVAITYERRMRDLARLRDAIGKMS
jgi:hypothetical protein